MDFSSATRGEDGRLCVIKEEEIETLSKDPVLDCSHKQVTRGFLECNKLRHVFKVEKCHFTYITYFTPNQEEQVGTWNCSKIFEHLSLFSV